MQQQKTNAITIFDNWQNLEGRSRDTFQKRKPSFRKVILIVQDVKDKAMI